MHFMPETRPDWLGGREFSYHLDSLLTGGLFSYNRV